MVVRGYVVILQNFVHGINTSGQRRISKMCKTKNPFFCVYLYFLSFGGVVILLCVTPKMDSEYSLIV